MASVEENWHTSGDSDITICIYASFLSSDLVVLCLQM